MSTDSLKDIADYFDKHGDSNERMLAYYILGCVYFDARMPQWHCSIFMKRQQRQNTTDSSCVLPYTAQNTRYGRQRFSEISLPSAMHSTKIAWRLNTQ